MSSSLLHFIWRQGLSLNLELTGWLGWLASDPLESPCAETTGLWHHACLLCGCADALQQALHPRSHLSAPGSISNQEVQVTTGTHQVLVTFPEQVIPEVKQAKDRGHERACGDEQACGEERQTCGEERQTCGEEP